MSYESLPDSDHFVRSCKRKWTAANDDGTVVLVPMSAFSLREDEAYLSGSWLERACNDPEAQMSETLRLMRLALDVPKSGFLARLNVGESRELGRRREARVRFLHRPKENANPCYASLSGTTNDNIELLQDLAHACSLYQVREDLGG